MDWKRQACSSPCYLASEQRAGQRRHCLNWKNPHKAFIDSLVDFHKGPGWHQMRLRWSSDEQERWPFVPLKSNSGCAVKGQMEGKKVLEHRELFCIAPSQDHQIKRDQSPCFFALEIRLLTFLCFSSVPHKQRNMTRWEKSDKRWSVFWWSLTRASVVIFHFVPTLLNRLGSSLWLIG